MTSTPIDICFKLLERSCADAAITCLDITIDQARNDDYLLRSDEDLMALLLLASHWPFQALAEHLDACVEIRHGKCPGLFRCYDPRLFPQLLSHVLHPDQQQLWLRPLKKWK